jgi:hypothetical protein
MQDSDDATERRRKLSSEANIATVLIIDQEKLIEDLLSQKVQLLRQISLLREQLTRYEELLLFPLFVCSKDFSLQGNEEIHAVIDQANRRLEETVIEIGRQLEEGNAKLQVSAKNTRTLLSMSRLFIEFGDDNRAAFVAFLEREYSIKVDRASFKQVLTHLIEILPADRIDDLSETMKSLLL